MKRVFILPYTLDRFQDIRSMQNMRHLFLDTSTEKSFVGLGDRGKLLEIRIMPEGLQNSKFILPALIDLLKAHGMTLKDLSLISCSIGPGSYTGLRVGAALAQGISYALKCPLVSFNSLEGFIPRGEGVFAVLLDAKYGGLYALKGGFGDPEVVSLERAKDYLKGVKVIVTPHLQVLKAKLENLNLDVEWEEGIPSGERIAEISFERFQEGKVSKTGELKLLYLRKTQAEIERTQQS